MRLTLVIFSLQQVGGAERVMSILANYWAGEKKEITILTFDDGKKPIFYKLDPRIRHFPLDISGYSSHLFKGIWNNLTRIKKLRTAIKETKPDIIISFIDVTNVITLLSTRGLGIPVIVSERIDPTLYSIGTGWEKLRKWTYQFTDGIVVQTNSAANYFMGNLSSRVCIIPNPVLPIADNDCTNKLNTASNKRTIMAMGRLTRQKGFDLLIKAFAQLKNTYPNWSLVIFGEGELRSELENLIQYLNLKDRVNMPGIVPSNSNVFKAVDLFVMSSRFEGFPNVLCEAMACGLPVISTNCPAGPEEIIRHGIDGILVPNEDVSALSAAMDRLMSDEQERQRLANRALEVTERFSLDKIMNLWENLLEQVVENKQ